MEETERPRKLQKLDHSTNESAGDGVILTTADGESLGKSPPQGIENHSSSNETPSNYGQDGGDTIEIGVANTSQNESGDAPPPLSKNQLKKKRRQEKWEAGKEFRKAKRKEKEAEKKERRRAARAQDSQNSPGAGENGTVKELSERRAAATMKYRTLLPITLIIDCGYDELMTDQEKKSLSSQITRCYSDNLRASYRAHLMVSSFNGMLKERFDGTLQKAHEHWKGVKFIEDNYMAAAEVAKDQMKGPKGGRMAGLFAEKEGTNAKEEGEIVYLSSDSPNTLTELKPYSTYIIGGLVDRNRHKGVCYKSAMDNGIKTAKLPIGDYMKMSSRFVLATNHVVEIMLKWLELGDWGEAFIRVMPKRKGGELKERKDSEVDTPGKEAEEQEAKNQEAEKQEAGKQEAEKQGIEGNSEQADRQTIDTTNS